MFQPSNGAPAAIGAHAPTVQRGSAPIRTGGAHRHLALMTFLRFGAAVWVLVFHLQSLLQIPAPFSRVVFNGAYAMSFFFVLSGVVLTYGYFDLGTSAGQLKKFYVARFARIYPIYFLVHLVGLLWFPVAISDWARWAYINTTSVVGVQAWFPWANAGVNAGTWSISCEFFFYLLFPALLPLIKNLTTGAHQFRAAFYLCLFIGFLGLADFAFAGGGTFPLLYISPLLRLPEFVLGMVIGVAVWHRGAERWMPWWMLVAAGAVVVLVSFNSAHDVGLWTRANIVVVPAIAWFIYTAVTYELDRPSILRHRLARLPMYLGEVSYALFLVQLPLLLWLRPALTGGGWLEDYFAQTPRLVALIVVLAIGALAVALHELVEKPARSFLLRRLA